VDETAETAQDLGDRQTENDGEEDGKVIEIVHGAFFYWEANGMRTFPDGR
jgi:hypothetical protein